MRDFGLGALRRRAPGDDTVKLDQFVVASSKAMDNAALAINTQRFAANQVNVIAADEFGGAAESKVGEVLKSLPGISMTLGGGGAPNFVSRRVETSSYPRLVEMRGQCAQRVGPKNWRDRAPFTPLRRCTYSGLSSKV